MPREMTHKDGPGLKVLESTYGPYYGRGYCDICGDRGPNLVPALVRYWEPDEGWKLGVLCVDCGRDASERGPKPDDYAVAMAKRTDPAIADALVSLGDNDAALVAYDDAYDD